MICTSAPAKKPRKMGEGGGKGGYVCPGARDIEINVPAIYPNALPLNMTPSSSLGTLSTNDTRSPIDRV